jgi:hypothetical protein
MGSHVVHLLLRTNSPGIQSVAHVLSNCKIRLFEQVRQLLLDPPKQV